MENIILPDLQAALLCEDVRQEASGSQTLVGVINAIPAPVVPFGLIKLCLWTRWCGGTGRFQQTAHIYPPSDESRAIATGSVQFHLPGMESHATSVHIFGGVEFRSRGLYHVEILLEGELKLRFGLPILPPPGGPGGN